MTEDIGTGAEDGLAHAREPFINRRVMITAILVTIIVILAAVAGIVLYGLNVSRAPRTVVERAISTAEAATRQQPAVAKNWVDLTYAYISAGRYSDAKRAIESGKAAEDLPAFSIATALILEKQGKTAEAITAYEAAKQHAVDYHDAQAAAAAAKGIMYSAPNEDLADAAIYKARLLVKSGDAAAAVKEYDVALKVDPNMSDVLVERADAKASLGDASGARADYTQALRFVPDLQGALQGLAKLGESK